MSEVVREVRMHAPGSIEGVACPGGFPGNSIVRLDANNEVVEVVPMNAPVVQEADVPVLETQDVSKPLAGGQPESDGVERLGG